MSDLLRFLSDPQQMKRVALDAIDATSRGVVTNTLGGLVDLGGAVTNLGIAGYGYAGNKLGFLKPHEMPALIQKPVGGSEWWGDKMQQAGLLSGYRNPTAEVIAGGLLGPATSAQVSAKAPQIAAGLLQMEANAAKPNPANWKQRGAVAWHSSPYKFDKFEHRGGTGEGNASFGAGTYLAESEKVSGVGGKYFDQFKTHPAAKETGGPFAYKVDIPDSKVAKMLDWDKPLAQQAPEVRQAITKLARQNEQVMDAIKRNGMGEMKGSVFYAALQDIYTADAKRKAILAGADAARFTHSDLASFSRGNDTWASSQLNAAGIPGIRYFDSESRGAGSGTTNFVVFPGEEAALAILERNGVKP